MSVSGSTLSSAGTNLAKVLTPNNELAAMNYTERSIIPIDFKGDGIGYSAGYGYNLKNDKPYGDFVSGFPLKYYRVFGSNVSNVTQKIRKLRTLLNAKKSADEKEKEQAAKEERDKRNQARLKKEYNAQVAAQLKDAELAAMQIERILTRANNEAIPNNATITAQLNQGVANYRKRKNAAIKKAYSAYQKGGPLTPNNAQYVRLFNRGKYSYANLPQSTRTGLETRERERLKKQINSMIASRKRGATLRRLTRIGNRTAYGVNTTRRAFGARPMTSPQNVETYYSDPTAPQGRVRYVRPGSAAASAYPGPAYQETRPAAPGFFSRLGSRISGAFRTRKNGATAPATAATSSAEAAFGK